MSDALPPLLPCPFCGGEAERDRTPLSRLPWRVLCGNDDCPVRPYGVGYASPAEAEKAWNTRAPSRVLASVEGEIRVLVGVGGHAWVALRTDPLLPGLFENPFTDAMTLAAQHGAVHGPDPLQWSAKALQDVDERLAAGMRLIAGLKGVPAAWLHTVVNALAAEGTVENGQPVSITITALPWPSSRPVPEPEEYPEVES